MTTTDATDIDAGALALYLELKVRSDMRWAYRRNRELLNDIAICAASRRSRGGTFISQ
jgi:hypothetical protein